MLHVYNLECNKSRINLHQKIIYLFIYLTVQLIISNDTLYIYSFCYAEEIDIPQIRIILWNLKNQTSTET